MGIWILWGWNSRNSHAGSIYLSIYLYMCVCMYVCMYACMYVCMYIFIYIYIYRYGHIDIGTYWHIDILIYIYRYWLIYLLCNMPKMCQAIWDQDGALYKHLWFGPFIGVWFRTIFHRKNHRNMKLGDQGNTSDSRLAPSIGWRKSRWFFGRVLKSGTSILIECPCNSKNECLITVWSFGILAVLRSHRQTTVENHTSSSKLWINRKYQSSSKR